MKDILNALNRFLKIFFLKKERFHTFRFIKTQDFEKNLFAQIFDFRSRFITRTTLNTGEIHSLFV